MGTIQQQYSEQELVRRQALKELEQLGIAAYPAEEFDVNIHASDIEERAEALKESKEIIRIAGRLMSRRVMGSASFFVIQDTTAKVQAYIRRDDVCPDDDKALYNTVFKKILDIGDFIGIEGYVFTTQTGETTIHTTSFKFLAKSLRPLPVVKEKDGVIYDAFTDPELRYRMRYVDLVVNAGVKDVFIKRSKVVQSLRETFLEKGYIEVETPILQAIHGGAAARPFTTHHNALDIPLYLRIANELYLKRLIVGGFEGVFEFAKNFRNEGIDRTHNPEFTGLEIYVAYRDYKWMMNFTEEMIEKVAMDIHQKSTVTVGEQEISFAKPFKRLTMFEAIKQYSGHDISNMDEEALRAVCGQLHIAVDHTMGKGKLIDELFSATSEKHLIQPTFIMDYPIEMSPLTKKHRSIEGLVERFELYVNGKEIANAYTELNDPLDQRARFEEQMQLAERGDEEAMRIDEDFLRALEYGMPPTAGLGIGIDRLTMLMTNQPSIQEVLFFPQLRPEQR